MTDLEFTQKLNTQCNKFKDLNYDFSKKYNFLCKVHHKRVEQQFSNSAFDVEYNANKKYNYVIMYGHMNTKEHQKLLSIACENNIPILLCEDAFIRGYDTWCNKKQKQKYLDNCGLLIDRIGFHYDSTVRTDLETLLNKYTVTPKELEFANDAIDKILKYKITKYNHQSTEFNRIIGRPNRKKVLVVDQSYNDWSIKISNGSDNDFESMLKTAIQENPDCDILVKVHPDTLARKNIKDNKLQLGYYCNIIESDNIYIIAEAVNPYTILQLVDKVYVYSTQFGFEALLANKEVHVFGTPFYAGWGLTIDSKKFEHRTRRLTLAELFFITYCKYSHWVDPATKKKTDILGAINYIEYIKQEYANEMQYYALAWCADSDLNNNIMALQSIKSFMANTNIINDFYMLTCANNPFIKYYRGIPNLKIELIDDFINAFAGSGRLSNFAYGRLKLFDKNSVFKKYKRIIYVDNDTIAVRKIDQNLLSVSATIKTPIAGVCEFKTNNPAFKNMIEFCKKNSLKYQSENYINTGVLVINAEEICNDDFNNLCKLGQDFNFPLCDQGLINYYYQQEKITPIKGKYNSYDFTDNSMVAPVIIHYPNTSRKIKTYDLFSKFFIKYVFNCNLK